jgi:hypothetical protein
VSRSVPLVIRLDLLNPNIPAATSGADPIGRLHERTAMITLTRRQARGLRGVFRRHHLGIGHKGIIPPLVFRAEQTRLRVHHAYRALAVEHVEDGVYRPHEAIALPLDALADIEGRDDSPITLECVAPDRTVVRWEDRGIPQTRDCTVLPLDRLGPFPEPPATFATNPATLLDALAEAARTATDGSTRYALECLQLRGTPREIVATDGH